VNEVEDIDDLDLETLIEAEQQYIRYNALEAMYRPGPFGISKYPKHAEIFEAGAKFRHRCFMGGNGVGKTYGMGGVEVAYHATGLYPLWWVGLRFDHAIKIRCCGDTRQTMREIIQPVLLGNFAELGEEEYGTGLIPRHLLGKPKVVSNTNGLVDFVKVKHVSGGWTTIQFRAYEQGRKAFQGTKFEFIWEDEEPPIGIHEENVQRGRGVDGRILLTFTPLSGFSDVVNNFLDWENANKLGASRFTLSCGWDDVPHLTEEWKRITLAETRPHLRNTRKLGIPTAGIGMVYPVEEEFITVRPFAIPPHFRRISGFDHGWHNTACVWIAYDKDEDVAYLYADYKRGETTTENHATAIKARGSWIPCRGDAAARAHDGEQIVKKYRSLGVDMKLPNKAVDAGIGEVVSRLEDGRLKVFATCVKWFDEFRRYRYDEKGNVVKQNDHLMDATRYAIMDLKDAKHPPSGREVTLTSDVRF